MKSIFPIKEFILHVGRYYFQEYLFVIDINRIIALDLVRLYNNVSVMLERMYRDSRCGSLMLPWTAELCVDHLGRESLYEAGERDEAIE